jgi:hypothetical protein
MKTQYFTASSLDGFIATEDDSLEWLFPLGDINDTSYPSFISQVGALAMGSSTYEWMLRHSQTVSAQMGTAWPYTQHAEMRTAAGSKNIWIVGGGDLAGQFADAGFLDEIIVQIGTWPSRGHDHPDVVLRGRVRGRARGERGNRGVRLADVRRSRPQCAGGSDHLRLAARTRRA